MATNIIQRIALEGGEAIKRQFKEIGDAGTKAFESLKSAGDKINANIGDKFADSFSGVPRQIESVKSSVKSLADGLGEVLSKAESTGKGFVKLGAGVTGAVAGFVALVNTTANSQTELEKAAAVAGTTAEKMQAMRVASAAAGVAVASYDGAMANLASSTDAVRQKQIALQNKQASLNRDVALGRITFAEAAKAMDDARFAASQQIDVYQRLGVKVLNASGRVRDAGEIEKDFADALLKVKSPTEQAANVAEAFGKKNLDMLPKLLLGRKGIEALEAEARRLAPALSKEAAGSVNTFSTRLELLGAVASSVKNQFLATFAGPLTDGINQFISLIDVNRGKLQELAETLAGKVNVAVQDLIAKMSGQEVTKGGFVETATQALTAFVEAAKIAGTVIVGAFTAIKAAADTVAEALNGLFGTQVSGNALILIAVIAKLTGTFGLISASISGLVTLVGALVAAFGAVPVIIGVLAAAFALWLVNASGGLDGLAQKWNALWAGIVSGFTALFITPFKSLWDGLLKLLDDLKDKAIAVFNAITGSAKNVADAVNGAGGGEGDGAPGFAGGGHVRGPGGSTGDRIRAWLSDNEYVHRARAVAKYGVGFMDAINNLRLSPDAVHALMGGMTHSMAVAVAPGRTRFASGGLVNAGAGAGGGGLQPVHFHLPGLGEVEAFMQRDPFDALTRRAGVQSMKSAGRKPTWYKG